MKTAVDGILHQFRELGGALAVALCDGEGRMIACSGDPSATVALSDAVSKLLRGIPCEPGERLESLFEDSPEYTILRDGPASVSLHVRRVGDDWALAAVWNDDSSVELRRFAAETAHRLQNVC